MTPIPLLCAMLFGFGAAILGMILYSAFGIITGIVIGYLSLGVGYLVGKAIRAGSGGIGGRRYQIAALAFTYFAVSMSAVPIGVYQAVKESNERKSHLVTSTPASTSQSSGRENETATQKTEAIPEAAEIKPARSSVTTLVGTLLFYGLASPFLELENPVNGALGIIILLVGIRIAWRLTAAPQIDILDPCPATSTSGTLPAKS